MISSEESLISSSTSFLLVPSMIDFCTRLEIKFRKTPPLLSEEDFSVVLAIFGGGGGSKDLNGGGSKDLKALGSSSISLG